MRSRRSARFFRRNSNYQPGAGGEATRSPQGNCRPTWQPFIHSGKTIAHQIDEFSVPLKFKNNSYKEISIVDYKRLEAG